MGFLATENCQKVDDNKFLQKNINKIDIILFVIYNRDESKKPLKNIKFEKEII